MKVHTSAKVSESDEAHQACTKEIKRREESDDHNLTHSGTVVRQWETRERRRRKPPNGTQRNRSQVVTRKKMERD